MTDYSDREIRINRLFDAPRAQVFQAWTKPEHVMHWWGPTGFTTTIQEMQVTAGGVWRFIMHGPDGRDYPNRIVFREIVINERLVYDQCEDVPEPTIQFEVTVHFSDEAGKTRLDLCMRLATAAMYARVVREFGAIEGAQQHLERLAAYLRRHDGNDRGTFDPARR